MQSDPLTDAYRSTSDYIGRLSFENDQDFREGLAIAALLAQSAFQLVLKYVKNSQIALAEILRRSAEIQWRAVEELTGLTSLDLLHFEDLYSSIFQEADRLVEVDHEIFPSNDCIESSIGCILDLHMFLDKPEIFKLQRAVSSYLHQATMLAVDRLTVQGEDVCGVMTEEKDAKVDNSREAIIYTNLLNWIFDEAAKLSASTENIRRLRVECQHKTDEVIVEAEKLFALVLDANNP